MAYLISKFWVASPTSSNRDILTVFYLEQNRPVGNVWCLFIIYNILREGSEIIFKWSFCFSNQDNCPKESFLKAEWTENWPHSWDLDNFYFWITVRVRCMIVNYLQTSIVAASKYDYDDKHRSQPYVQECSGVSACCLSWASSAWLAGCPWGRGWASTAAWPSSPGTGGSTSSSGPDSGR